MADSPHNSRQTLAPRTGLATVAAGSAILLLFAVAMSGPLASLSEERDTRRAQALIREAASIGVISLALADAMHDLVVAAPAPEPVEVLDALGAVVAPLALRDRTRPLGGDSAVARRDQIDLPPPGAALVG